MNLSTEVAIIGAGPAGLAAAAAAAQAGCLVTVVDAYARPGGQYYKQLAPGLHSERPGALHHAYDKAAQLFQVVASHPNIKLLSGANVWAASQTNGQFVLQIDQTAPDDGGLPRAAFELIAQSIILAPGAYDRGLAFPGWDLPGVMTVGGIQTLLKSFRSLPGLRVALAGSGPFLLPVAALLAKSGAQVVGVFEATRPRQWLRYAPQGWNHFDKLAEGAGYVATLKRHKVPLRYGRAVVRATGEGRLQRITVARLDTDWRVLAGQTEEIEVDTLGIGYGFMPSVELSYALGCEHRYDPVQAAFFARYGDNMESTQAGVFVAGEIGGIGGSVIALQQGHIAGWAAAIRLGKASQTQADRETARAKRELRHQQAFADLLNQMFALRPGRHSWATPETIICRCEEVTVGAVEKVVREGQARDARSVKLLTRCGMGLCQGRVCGHLVTGLVADITGRDPAEVGTFTTRPIVRPLPLGQLLKQ